MKMKHLLLIAPLVLVAAFFQNCSKIAVSDLGSGISEKQAVVVATDSNTGQNIPVDVDDTIGIGSEGPGDDLADNMSGDVSNGASEDQTAGRPSGDETQADLVAACGMDLKTIHRVVDLAQFEGQDVVLELLQGKTLIYSSNEELVLSSLNINAAVGRTILCGAKVNRLSVKKGRLEVYHSEIAEIGELKGKLIRDGASILPAGY